MKPLRLSLIAELTGGLLLGEDREISAVVTDSRQTRSNALFVALRGQRTDGHNHVIDALQSGSTAALVERHGSYGCPYILVDSTVAALAALARYVLRQSRARVIGVTGSMGKTSTKEFAAAALASQFSVFRSPGNMNTEIGLPLCVLEYADEEVMILEMAMRGQGQIAELTAISAPDVAVITNIGESHLEVLGSRGAIAAAKSEILTGMKTGGVAVLNRDDDYYAYLSGVAAGPVMSFGCHDDADFRISDVRVVQDAKYAFCLTTGTSAYQVRLPWPGRHNVHNAAAALLAATAVGADLEAAIRGLEECAEAAGRLRVISMGSYRVLDDTYNSSPAAAISALSTMAEMRVTGRRIAVLGDMLELGERAAAAHREVGEHAARHADVVLAVGPLARAFHKPCQEMGTPSLWFPSPDEALEYLQTEIGAGDLILIKGSRGLRMEAIVKGLPMAGEVRRR